jgi:hypothetical protein
LKVSQSKKARPAIGSLLLQGSKAEVENGGFISLFFPFSAGELFGLSCTVFDIEQISSRGGGVQLAIKASQKWLCFKPFETRFRVKPRTNLNTVYVFNNAGNIIRLTGTTGGFRGVNKGTTVFALSEGSAEIENVRGQKAQISGGQQAIASPSGIIVSSTPSVKSQVVGNRISTHPSNQVLINGIEARWLPPTEATVEVLSLSGQVEQYSVRYWSGTWLRQ